jgi:hypothetical protein
MLLKESSEEENEDLVYSCKKGKKTDNESGGDMMTDVSGLKS